MRRSAWKVLRLLIAFSVRSLAREGSSRREKSGGLRVRGVLWVARQYFELEFQVVVGVGS